MNWIIGVGVSRLVRGWVTYSIYHYETYHEVVIKGPNDQEIVLIEEEISPAEARQRVEGWMLCTTSV